MLQKPHLSEARSDTIVSPRTWITTPKVSPARYPTPQNIDYVSSLQYTQHQGHDSTKILNLTAPGNQTRGTSDPCSMFVDMANIATKPSSRDDVFVVRLAISTGAGLPVYG